MLFLSYRAVFFGHENGVAVFDLAFFRLAQGFLFFLSKKSCNFAPS